MITTKNEFLALWNEGKLGNKLRTWPSLAALRSDEYRGPVSIRSRRPGWKTMYYVPQDRLEQILLKEARLRGFVERDLHFNESAPDDRLILQGEFFDGVVRGAFYNRYLMYSRARLAMKDALALPLSMDVMYPGFRPMGFDPSYAFEQLTAFRHESEGLKTEMLLRAAMNRDSWEDFQILREQYPDHVIEFSIYDCCLGNCPGRNTLIWEVRSY